MRSEMVTRHAACAGQMTDQTDGGVGCVAEGHLYVLYLVKGEQVSEMLEALRTLHPTGTVTVQTPWLEVKE
jgi:hypothetical protein